MSGFENHRAMVAADYFGGRPHVLDGMLNALHWYASLKK